MKTIICYGQINFSDHVQEHYESASRDAARRARQLRQAGFDPVYVSGLGLQVTNVGLVRMSMVTAYGQLDTLPFVEMERI